MEDLKLLKVGYGTDTGLVSLRDGTLLACTIDQAPLSVPSHVPYLEVSDIRMTAVFGDEHNWNDLIDALMRVDWEELRTLLDHRIPEDMLQKLKQ